MGKRRVSHSSQAPTAEHSEFTSRLLGEVERGEGGGRRERRLYYGAW